MEISAPFSAAAAAAATGQNAGNAASGGNGGNGSNGGNGGALVTACPEDFTDDCSAMRLPFRSDELKNHSAAKQFQLLRLELR